MKVFSGRYRSFTESLEPQMLHTEFKKLKAWVKNPSLNTKEQFPGAKVDFDKKKPPSGIG